MLLPSGETVFAVEQYFVVHAESQILSSSEWTLHGKRLDIPLCGIESTCMAASLY